MNLEEHLSLGEFHVSNVIKNHISRGSPKQALVLYQGIRSKGVYFPGWVPLIFKACACVVPRLVLGKLLHSESIKFGICSDVMVGTSMINMYGKWGRVYSARKVFDEMPERNVATWNAMIGGYMSNGDEVSGTRLFEEIPVCRNTVTWIEMMKGYGKRKEIEKARELFERMPIELKNVKAWSVMLGIYVSNREMEDARMFFEDIPEKNSFVWSLMISGYFRIGDVPEATAVFYRVLSLDFVVWNTLITGYAQNGYSDDAIDAYHKMQREGYEPDEVTVSSVLSACAQSGRLDVGREVHSLINYKGIELNQFVSNALIDMYAKCGDLENATLVFESLSQRSVACWNSMISCLAIHGKCKEALEMFIAMESLDTKPDEITFMAVLTACAHGGLLMEGMKIFLEMTEKDVKPNVKHFGCLIHLLARSGKLKEAYGLMREMPMKPNDTVLGALLGACKVHLDTEMAEQVMKVIDSMGSNTNEERENHLVSISNLYAHAARWETSEMMRVEMEKRGLEKSPGFSSLVFT
ncbi:PREDICTED: pentatricopeptide repeat-containing protein At3g21470-like [Camelina sativa]|uniref:Pentatricopeptide repeat-containing protein At3g21470-like n=1 Tax=Camelina sativa TaxID=90675 RepID=A0ABM0XRT2_CAMSA|nr:PREDICTED: pentatricopeptide repeat-containing protein At3g21470-like [Camelina sativa]